MSQWGTNPASDPSGAGGESLPSGTSLSRPKVPVWIQVIPFFLSAILFLSAFFAIFSPLPLLALRFRAGVKLFWLAALSNALVVALASGLGSLSVFLVFFVFSGAALSGALKRQSSLERAVVAGLVAILVSGAALLLSYSAVKGVNPVRELKQQVGAMVDTTLGVVAGSAGGQTKLKAMLGGMEPEEFKEQVLLELPATIGVFSLVLVVVNLLMVLRLNPGGIAQAVGFKSRRLKFWKAPEYLVWPTIAAGVFLVVDFGRVSVLMTGVFKVFLAIYALQGLSILAFFFDIWQIKGILRTAGYALAVFLMMPLILSLGFFDLWFDFRSKFRQS